MSKQQSKVRPPYVHQKVSNIFHWHAATSISQSKVSIQFNSTRHNQKGTHLQKMLKQKDLLRTNKNPRWQTFSDKKIEWTELCENFCQNHGNLPNLPAANGGEVPIGPSLGDTQKHATHEVKSGAHLPTHRSVTSLTETIGRSSKDFSLPSVELPPAHSTICTNKPHFLPKTSKLQGW